MKDKKQNDKISGGVTYNDILKYRNVWMGLAILWIVFFHSGLEIPGLHFVKMSGYGGVDIFVFASGIGCFYSLNKDRDAERFMIRRIKKILPTYYVFLLFWIIYVEITGSISFQQILGNIFCIGWFLNFANSFNWYINGIWILYFGAIYMYSYIKRNVKLRVQIGFFLFILLFSMSFFNTHLLMLTSRIPLFYLGMIWASRALKKEKLSKRDRILIICSMVIGMIWLLVNFLFLPQYLDAYGLYWYPFILVIPGLCMLLSLFLGRLDEIYIGNTIVEFFRRVGKYTLEIYLVHMLVFDVFKRIVAERLYISENNFTWILTIIVIIPVSFLLMAVVDSLKRLLKGLLKKLRKNKGDNYESEGRQYCKD